MCIKRFAIAIVQVFGSTYLRGSNAEDTARLLEFDDNRGFQVCLNQLIVCTGVGRIVWRHGMDKKDATIILEAMADHETWIWHAFFGMSGSCNDINVHQRSPLMTRITLRKGPVVEFEANSHKYNYGYFLTDDIYPRW
jgi:hypothetical protein